MDKLVVYGNASLASNAYYELSENSNFRVVAFTVDEECIEADTLHGLPVVPFHKVATAYPPDEHRMLISVGYVKINRLRAERYGQAKAMGYELISHVSPRAVKWSRLVMGDNCQVGPNSVIYPSARIGNNVFIGASCVLAHDVVIGDHCFLSDGVIIAGSAVVGQGSYLGTSCAIRNKVTIGSECVVGAGALILEDTKDRTVYLGEPARLLPISSDQLPLA